MALIKTMKLIPLLIISASFLLNSCGNSTFDKEEDLLGYISKIDHGFVKEKSLNGIHISAIYRPIDLIVNQEFQNGVSVDSLDALREQYGRYLYFGLDISKGGKEVLLSAPKNREEYSALANQLSFGMDRKIHLFTAKKDTIEMIDYVYPKMYGLSKKTSLLLIYPRDVNLIESESFTISVEDIGMNTGELKFKFDTDILKQEPQINFN